MDTEKKRKRPPRRLDLDNDSHRERLRKAHELLRVMEFAALYQAQTNRKHLKRIRRLLGRKPRG